MTIIVSYIRVPYLPGLDYYMGQWRKSEDINENLFNTIVPTVNIICPRYT